MSAFLGPIHFWLYHKIGKQESLTKTIAAFAARKNWITSADAYTRELPALETAIDESNIHGWLQAQIHDAETRYAQLVETIFAEDAARLDALCDVAYDFGQQHAVQGDDAPSLYRAMEDFFVNGMPCDRVNSVTVESPDRVSWEMTQDIHASYWHGSGDVYYALRKRVMDGMLDGTGFTLYMPDTAHYTIMKD